MSEHPDPVQTGPEEEGRLVAPASAPAALPPARIGRYRVERLLGEGGFGRVYLAHDEQLGRPVAIKTPHARLVAQAGDAAAYLAEARTVANLDHPNIVPVYDVGGDDQFPCYVVSKYIDGLDLAKRLKQSRLSVHEAVEVTATAAEALHHAHKQGLVHRDVKPGNILLDKSGKAFVADFGLALREQDAGKGPRFAGTPAYMSPEQARGEGHRVDGRSDIFSLGVVLYEMLAGRRPFIADSVDEVLEQIAGVEARPPRQTDDRIPKELERICLKALAKRATERYTTAKDLADDLRCFLASASVEERSVVTGQARREADAATPAPSPPPTPSDQQPVRIVPKGLRSFDAGDADFFLELLPGPRDRDGLPESIRFWQSRIETPNADGTFSVGLIYGPSGCGKSSLVKAGLLPRLAKSVTAVYVEAAEEMEARLLKGLRRQAAGLPGDLGLVESLAALRRGRFLPSGQKVLLVLDQFEQWLHAKRSEADAELVDALRQCDGGRVQCIVMVRDDFWLAVSRFMQVLEIRVVEGENSRLIDLFDLLHARKVLAGFGRAYGRLPDNLGQCTRDQDAFLDQAVAGLSQDGKVVSVRLALFAEMVKGKPWTQAVLRAVGGAEGVGIAFLEETFAASTAPPPHRLHQKAAQGVLSALLPEAGTDIKGHMRSQKELAEAAGYAHRPKDFDDLLRILDGELRLITPTDPEGKDDTASSPAPAGAKYYQLTHDYLVPSLRDWLTRKQKETRRGRAELLLADRAAVWNARLENRQLPSLRQWCQIRWRTRKKNWTPPQRKMMARATRYHVVRGLAAVFLLVLAGWAAWEVNGSLRASGLVRQVLDADIDKVPEIVRDMEYYRPWAEPKLRTAYAEAESAGNADRQLRASLALLPADQGQRQYLRGRLLEAAPQEVLILRQQLEVGKDDWLPALWRVVGQPEKPAQRLRAACALALYDPENAQWGKASGPVVAQLVAENPVYLEQWLTGFRPVRDALRPALIEVYLDKKEDRAAERSLATTILADYAAADANALGDLILDAEPRQFVVLAPRLQAHREGIVARMEEELQKKLTADAAEEKQVRLAKRQARAAEALLYLGRADAIWPLLKHSPDPTVRSYLVNDFADHGVEAATLVRRLQAPEIDVSERRALLVALGAYAPERVPDGVREPLLQKLLDDYQNDPDAGVHGSTEWLLRQWGRLQDTRAIDERLRGKPPEKRQWYVNGHGQTFTIVHEGEPFWMGSPENEAGHLANENRHLRKIPRSFALDAKEITRAEFERFLEANPTIKKEFDANGQAAPLLKQTSPEAETPIVLMNWYLAAQFCNWLSKEEGIDEEQWCYPIDPKRIAEGMELGPEFLDKTGYRLPTESEWEYACRAGAATSRFYGGGDELLGNYAWYAKTSPDRTQVVGRLRPNDWGLFDMQGNVWQWCHDVYRPVYATKEGGATSDVMDMNDTLTTNSRVLRGGSFGNRASIVRSAYRFNDAPAYRDDYYGFRPARTLPCRNPQAHSCGACQGAKSRWSSRVGLSQGGSAE